MANDVNVITLSVSSYNQIKAENFRQNLFLDNLMTEALVADGKLVFDSGKVETALRFCFPDRVRKKLEKEGGNQDADLPQGELR